MTAREAGGAAIAQTLDRGGFAKPGRNFRGTFKLGDLALQITAGLVLLFLFLPILVIMVFSFNQPAGKFNYTWQGFTWNNWAHPSSTRR